MNHEEILEKLNEVFHEVFDDDSLVITETTTADQVEDWDSLAHISLIEAVEQEFSVKFRMQEVSGMKNVGEMVEIIANRAGETAKKKRGFFRR
jgi:acyl carrier protein